MSNLFDVQTFSKLAVIFKSRSRLSLKKTQNMSFISQSTSRRDAPLKNLNIFNIKSY